jgi:hypothetical protein
VFLEKLKLTNQTRGLEADTVQIKHEDSSAAAPC